jgi:carbon storage regulator CsrA
MLNIGRKRDDEIVIQTPDGTEVIIKVCDVRGGRVELGFDAPLYVNVYRRELANDVVILTPAGRSFLEAAR